MTVDAVRHALLEAGAIVDEEYGVITVNPKGGDFVLRAEATPAQVETLSEHLELEFFPDVAITPTERGTS
jgi:hypothetical protein